MNTSSSWSSTSTSSRAARRQDPFGCAQQAALSVLELFDQARRRVVGDSEQRRLELLERIGAGEHLHDLPGLGARQGAPAERGHEAGADRRRFAAPARADNGEEAGLRQPVDELRCQHLPSEEIGSVRLLEGAQALVRVACLQALVSPRRDGTERTPKGDILRQVRELGTDPDHVDRINQALEPNRAMLDVFDALDLPRQVSDLTARKDLRGTGEAAQPSSQVKRASSVAAVDTNSLAGVEPDPDR